MAHAENLDCGELCTGFLRPPTTVTDFEKCAGATICRRPGYDELVLAKGINCMRENVVSRRLRECRASLRMRARSISRMSSTCTRAFFRGIRLHWE